MPKISLQSSTGFTESGWRWSVFKHEEIELRPGFLSFRVSGKGAYKRFQNEPGGHRWQRVPPTEKRGRVQTSTVTVAVLEEPSESEIKIDKSDIEESFTRGSGAGGQHRNKTDTAVILRHRPTGILIRVESGKSQYHNRVTAMGVLRAKLKEAERASSFRARDEHRRDQVGSGMRGDKRRTIAVQRDTVVDHITGKSVSFKEFSRGQLKKLY